jgi:hypothetical protein
MNRVQQDVLKVTPANRQSAFVDPQSVNPQSVNRQSSIVNRQCHDGL